MPRTLKIPVSILAMALIVSMAVEGTMHHHGLVAHSPDCPVCVASHYTSGSEPPEVEPVPPPPKEWVEIAAPVVVETKVPAPEPLSYSPSLSPPVHP